MRVDIYLVLNGFAESRCKAKAYIEKGTVFIDGKCILKPSEIVDNNAPHDVVITETEKYVGRGGSKLEAAVKKFGVDVEGKKCIDIGASTGGFTDCLLQYGAFSVIAVDSGRDQLHEKIRSDPRVTSYESFNARNLTTESVGGAVLDIAVMDVSFISQTLIIPSLSTGILKQGAHLVTLIKPQFEVGKHALGKNGVVKKDADRLNAVLRVVECALNFGFIFKGLIVSPIRGGDGNVEYLAHFSYDKCAEKDDPSNVIMRVRSIFKNLQPN